MAEAFGTVKEFREALSTRLYPLSWSGSIIPYLRKYLIPLKEWYGHPGQEIQSWARDTHRTLERSKEIGSRKAEIERLLLRHYLLVCDR